MLVFYSLIVGIIGAIIVLGLTFTKQQKKPSPTPTITISPSPSTSPTETGYCTADAKQCPDGSWVGRVGPKCEFAACPKD